MLLNIAMHEIDSICHSHNITFRQNPLHPNPNTSQFLQKISNWRSTHETSSLTLWTPNNHDPSLYNNTYALVRRSLKTLLAPTLFSPITYHSITCLLFATSYRLTLRFIHTSNLVMSAKLVFPFRCSLFSILLLVHVLRSFSSRLLCVYEKSVLWSTSMCRTFIFWTFAKVTERQVDRRESGNGWFLLLFS